MKNLIKSAGLAVLVSLLSQDVDAHEHIRDKKGRVVEVYCTTKSKPDYFKAKVEYSQDGFFPVRIETEDYSAEMNESLEFNAKGKIVLKRTSTKKGIEENYICDKDGCEGDGGREEYNATRHKSRALQVLEDIEHLIAKKYSKKK